ncbi:MAG: DUF2563 family protein [Mycobacterium sp.]|uniref:DUF2563 family protein n=1 Tax=Mycobacterium sp. TaxID=1785 RepID=UPI00261DC461|nr:DUF2563 family protein [Mycobacterium sp.]MDI3313422.1 DUF2563 family protein [Mycobacterium sp.]
MFVDTGLLHAGASDSQRAGKHAQDGAHHLARAPLLAGMFGDFAVAEAFHAAMSAAHAHHVTTLVAHHQALTGIGEKAHHAAANFTGTEERNTKLLRDVV